MAAHHSSITYEDGSLYEGTLHPQSGLPHGEGMMKFSDGSVYSGQWADDLREGVGTERCAGDEYKGGWHIDRKHGFGTCTYAAGDRFEGEGT